MCPKRSPRTHPTRAGGCAVDCRRHSDKQAQRAILSGALYTELALPRAVIGFATFFYALSGNHAMSVAWLSGRNTLLATACGLFAVLLHLRAAARSGGARLGLQLSAANAL